MLQIIEKSMQFIHRMHFPWPPWRPLTYTDFHFFSIAKIPFSFHFPKEFLKSPYLHAVTHYFTFCVWFISFCIIFRLVHVLPNNWISFLKGWIVVHWIHSLCICQWALCIWFGYSECATMNMGICICLGGADFIPLSIHLEERLLGHVVVLFLISFGNTIVFFQNSCTSSH